MPRDTRSDLLEFAEDMARKSGFTGFSYADIANAVGIKKASIHYHFPTKTELAAALMQSYTDDMNDACAAIDRRHPTGAARLEAQIKRYRDAVGEGSKLCLCVALSLNPEVLKPATIALISDYRTQTIAWLTSAFALGTSDKSVWNASEPAKEAAATLALLEGAQLAARAQLDVCAFDAATLLLRERLHQKA